MSNKKIIKPLIIILCIPLLLEVFVFNFRFWESLFFSNAEAATTRYEDGVYYAEGINAKVRNIYVNATDSADIVHLRVIVSDQANTDFGYDITEVVNSIGESRYIRIHPDGVVKNIRLDFHPYEDVDTSVPGNVEVEFNVVRPFSFRVIRFIVLMVIASLVYLFRPKSGIYSVKLWDNGKKMGHDNKMIVTFAIIVMCSFWILILMKYEDVPIAEYHDRQHVEAIYSYQAEALLDGHTYLNIEAPAYLASMDNPYDPAQRNAMAEETGIRSRGDFAYYNGRYYSYYGVVPTVMFYLPYMALTGQALPNSVPVFFCSIVFIIAAFMMILQLTRRYSSISVGHYLLISIGTVFASFAVYCVITPWIYSVAFISGLSFVTAALALWLYAERVMSSCKDPDRSARVIASLIGGSVLMSLAFGSRPSYILYVFLAFPIFGKAIREKHFFSKRGLINTLAVIIPALILCSAVLFYNYIRFDSFLDFGAKRNLSIDVMYHEMTPSTLGLGIFEYLFQLPSAKGTFPYIHSAYDWTFHMTDHQGVLFFDPVFGGVFTLAPFTLFSLFLFRRRKTLKDSKLYGLGLLSIVIALILMIVDIQMGGISMRYQIDFALLIALASAVVMIDFLGKNEIGAGDRYAELFHRSLILCTALTVIWLLMTSLALEKQNPMLTYSTNLYYSLKYLIFVLR